METPHLDEAIEQLKGLYERVGANSTKEKLQEYEAIKKALSIHLVSNCPDCGSESLHQYKLHHIHCKNCKQDFNKGCD